MKIKFLLSNIILFFLLINQTKAQDITFSGPSGVTAVASGTIVSLTAAGQTAQKYISYVPTFGYSNYYDNSINSDVKCDLYETNYNDGIFKYKFVNNGSIAKKIKFLFVDVRITTVSSDATYSSYLTNIEFEITVQPKVYTSDQLYPFPPNYSSKEFNFTTSNDPSSYTSIEMNNQTPILTVGQSIASPNNLYRLTLQSDGNLVFYKKNTNGSETGIWNSQTNGRPQGNLYFQTDGNLVLYGLNNSPSNPATGIWASNINATGSTAIYSSILTQYRPYLAIQNDGNLVIYWPAFLNDTHQLVNVVLAATDTNQGIVTAHAASLISYVNNSNKRSGNNYIARY